MSYNTQARSIKKVLKSTGVQSSAKTHIGRKSVKNLDVDKETKRALGRWNESALDGRVD